jgi:hypothetical protein
MDIAAGDRIVAAFLIKPGMVIPFANFNMIENHMTRPGRIHYADRVENVAARTLEYQSAGMQGTAIAGVVGSASKSYVRRIDLRGAMNLGDFTRIIGEEDWFLWSAGTLLHLVEPSRSVHILRVNAASKADCLASSGHIESSLQSLPRFS